MARKRIFILLAAVCLLLSASEAYAWGPATHIRLASDLLGNLSLLPPALAAILARYGAAYMYGTLAADVVFAKRLSKIKQICHHWSTGFRLLKNAPDDRGRAFAYGYLSHLAADTVAHGKFIPHQIMSCGTTVNFGHLYWEMRADAAAGEAARLTLQRSLSGYHEPYHEAMSRVLTGTLLPYEMNRAVFDRLNRLSARPGYHRSLEIWARLSRWDLCPILLDGFHKECVDRTLSVLKEGSRSPLLAEDPSGTAALAFASAHRKDARRRHRRGLSPGHRATEAAAGHAPRRSSDRS